MRNTVAIILVLGTALVSPLAAQPTAASLRVAVPAALDVAGLHVVLNEGAQRLVQQKTDGLLRHRPSFQARVDLADATFPIIDRVLKEEGVPLDFHYLALQESALQPDAESAHAAVGYWQLKRETATSLGLLVNSAVDERRHLTASTRAAARYLARNNVGLRNWFSALLSYNTGLGGVKPYLLPTDADATQVLVSEATPAYVLMFLAHKVAYEPFCGLNPKPPLRLQEFAAVPGQTLEAQAQTIYADPVALARHNRWLLAPVVPADRPYTLVVPVSDAAQAAGLLAQQRLGTSAELLTTPARSTRNAAEVRLNQLRTLIALPGETPADLARRANQRLPDFLRHNEMTAFDAAIAGRPYYLESKRDDGPVEYHVLQTGETAFDVAQKYGMRQRALLTKNRLSPLDELRPGRVLWLQHTRPRDVAAEFRALPKVASPERPANDGSVASSSAPAPLPAGASTPAGRANQDSADGWGEALPAPVAPAAPAPPAQPEPAVAALPPPVAAPLSAPLADEPAADEATPVAAVAAAPAPVATPAPKPVRPVVATAPLPVATAAKAPVAPAPGSMHRVEPGETVYSLSRRFQVPPTTLMALNHLAPPANLAVGQLLLVAPPAGLPGPAPAAGPSTSPPRPNLALYVPKPAPVPAAGAPMQHTVAQGETLYSIARRYGLTVADLQAWNAKAGAAVRVGEVLRVRK